MSRASIPSVVAPGTQPADHAQPRRHRLAQQRRLGAGDERLVLERQPQVRWIGAQRLAKESRRRDTGNGEGVSLDQQRRADNRGVAAVEALPRVIRQHHHWRRGGVSSSAVNVRPANAPTPSVVK